MPDLRLPSQPQGITAHWLVPNYTAWTYKRSMCVNNLPIVALDSGAAGIRTRDLLIASPAPTAMPPSHTNSWDHGKNRSVKQKQKTWSWSGWSGCGMLRFIILCRLWTGPSCWQDASGRHLYQLWYVFPRFIQERENSTKKSGNLIGHGGSRKKTIS